MKLVKENLGKVSITVEKDYWSSDKSYDRLVIVEKAGVGCFISRKPVPTNIDIDNREYWIRVGKISSSADLPIVTSFGDSIEVAVAQKTITDKLNEVDSELESNTTFRQQVANNLYLGKLATGVAALYIGGRVTNRTDDWDIKYNLETFCGINFDNDLNGCWHCENYLTADTLVQIVDGDIPIEFFDTDLSAFDLTIIQVDTSESTLQDYGDVTDRLDMQDGIGTDISAYDNPDSFITKYCYAIDRLLYLNPDMTVILIGPPDYRYEAQYEALKRIAELTNTTFIAPVTIGASRYDWWSTTATIGNQSKIILEPERLDTWSKYIIRNIKQTV